MPRRTTPLVTGEYYHVYNRGVARQPVFFNKRDYERFLLTLSYYRFLKLPVRLSHFLQLSKEIRTRLMAGLTNTGENMVALISFVLMPNHFHLLVKQTAEHGISTFLSHTVNSYTRYLNTKQARVGPLFQGAFKAVRIETDEQLLHLSRYIHLNPVRSLVVKESELLAYPWSSLPDFLRGESSFVEVGPVLEHFISSAKYRAFVVDQADYLKKIGRIKHLILEQDISRRVNRVPPPRWKYKWR